MRHPLAPPAPALPQIPLAHTETGTHFCTNYWCQKFEYQYCQFLGLVTWLSWNADETSRRLASNGLAEHWALMERYNRQHVRQAEGHGLTPPAPRAAMGWTATRSLDTNRLTVPVRVVVPTTSTNLTLVRSTTTWALTNEVTETLAGAGVRSFVSATLPARPLRFTVLDGQRTVFDYWCLAWPTGKTNRWFPVVEERTSLTATGTNRNTTTTIAGEWILLWTTNNQTYWRITR